MKDLLIVNKPPPNQWKSNQYAVLLEQHVRGAGLADRIGGKFGQFAKNYPKNNNGYPFETCASQISYALNYSGFPVTNVEANQNPQWIKGGIPRALKGGDGKLYITSVMDMIVYLDGKFGKSIPFKCKDYAELDRILKDKRGIIAFGFRHVDLWYQEWNPETHKYEGRSHYYICVDDASSKLRGIFFWDFDAPDA